MALEKDDLDEDDTVKALIKNGTIHQRRTNINKGKTEIKPQLLPSTDFIFGYDFRIKNNIPITPSINQKICPPLFHLKTNQDSEKRLI